MGDRHSQPQVWLSLSLWWVRISTVTGVHVSTGYESSQTSCFFPVDGKSAPVSYAFERRRTIPTTVGWLVAKSTFNSVTPTDCSLPGSSVHRVFRQEYWSRLPFPSPGDLPEPGIKPMAPTASPALQVDSLPLSQWGSPYPAIRL